MQHANTGRPLDDEEQGRRAEGLWAFDAPVKLYRTIKLQRRASSRSAFDWKNKNAH